MFKQITEFELACDQPSSFHHSLASLVKPNPFIKGWQSTNIGKCPCHIVVKLPRASSITGIVILPHLRDETKPHISHMNIYLFTKLDKGRNEEQPSLATIIQESKRFWPVANFQISESAAPCIFLSKSAIFLKELEHVSPCLMTANKQIGPSILSSIIEPNVSVANSRVPMHVIENVRYILIKIISMSPYSAKPCLGALEIFSDQCVHPSSSSLNHPEVPLSSSDSKATDSSTVMKRTNSSLTEHFLDPFTLEPMLRPVLLPSGKYVDWDSLETFWRKQPHQAGRDPFTLCPVSRDKIQVDYLLQRLILQALAETSTLHVSGYKVQTSSETDHLPNENTTNQIATHLPIKNGQTSSILHSTRQDSSAIVNEEEFSDCDDDEDRVEELESRRSAIHFLSKLNQQKKERLCKMCSQSLQSRSVLSYTVSQGCYERLCKPCAEKLIQQTCSRCSQIHSRADLHKLPGG